MEPMSTVSLAARSHYIAPQWSASSLCVLGSRLRFALQAGRTSTVQLLTSLGADIKQLEEITGNTVLHIAHMTHLPLLHFILGCGACPYPSFAILCFLGLCLFSWPGIDVNATNSKGETPLHLAVRGQSAYGREYLVSHGAFVDGNSFVDSPLIEAIRVRSPGAVEYLIHNGANPNLPGLDGKSPLAIALEMNESEGDDMSRVIKTLRSKDAKAFTAPRNRSSIV